MPMPVSRTEKRRRTAPGGGGGSGGRAAADASGAGQDAAPGQAGVVVVVLVVPASSPSSAVAAAAAAGSGCGGRLPPARGVPSAHTSSSTHPASVNLTALLSTLRSTCWSLAASATRIGGTEDDTAYATRNRLRAASEPAMSTAASIAPPTANSDGVRATRSASAREKSRMSVTSVNRASPEHRTVLTKSHCAGDSAVSASSCPTAIMPLSGVRISCDMRARNCDLASVAATAAAAAARAATSARLRATSSVTSDWTPT